MVAPDASGFQLYSSVRYDATLRSVAGDEALKHAGWNYANSSPYYMLDLHRDRLLRAATHWGWEDAVAAVSGDAGLQRLSEVLNKTVVDERDGPNRCRITLSKDGQIGCDVSGATATPLAGLFPPEFPAPGFMTSDPSSNHGKEEASPLLLQMRDTMGQVPYEVTLDDDKTTSSPYTHYKTTRRQIYDAARKRAGITGPELKEVLLVNSSSGVIMDGSISTVYFWRNGRWVTPPVPPKYGKENGSGGLDGTTRRWALERKLAVEEEVKADSLQHGEECWMSNGVRGYLFGKVNLE
ncbi:Aminodeoxychorismate lyase [Sporothrix eucalyptigena]|uniref:Aminodeoxychorismate lyase n=1 Tax=Sporothrix eucalyptigena TaxID=1812306 RepID=A0ABP0C492_9PEZI